MNYAFSYKLLVGVMVVTAALAYFGPFRVATAAYDKSGRSGLVQCGNTAGDPCTVDDIFNVIVIVTNYLIGLAGVVAVISIVWAGFSMVLAAGKAESIGAAKKRLTNSLIGLGLVAFAFLVINAVLYGTLGLGVFGGEKILTDPGSYIQNK